MEYQNYVNEKKKLYDLFLAYIEDTSEDSENSKELFDYIKNQKIGESRDELEDALHLILKISKNHRRHATFWSKIDKILTFFEEDIKQTFTNSELFNFFSLSKRILLFLIEKQIIKVDDSIVNFIIQRENSKKRLFFINKPLTKELIEERKQKINDLKYSDYYQYFYPEIKDFLDEEKRKKIESELLNYNSSIFNYFDEKRKIGENDSYLSSLIREDSVEEFITYTTSNNYTLSSRLNHSLFETNTFIIKHNPSLIEYAAFFGSIQIFQFLKLNKVELTSSLWLFAIHGNNPDLIHLLEEDQVLPKDKTYEKCLKESIKCHHNDIANYFKENMVDEKIESENLESDYNKNILSYCFHYYNYAYFPNEFNNKFIFYYACFYNYFKLLFILLQTGNVNINEKIILNFFIFKQNFFLF